MPYVRFPRQSTAIAIDFGTAKNVGGANDGGTRGQTNRIGKRIRAFLPPMPRVQQHRAPGRRSRHVHTPAQIVTAVTPHAGVFHGAGIALAYTPSALSPSPAWAQQTQRSIG